MMYRGKPSCVMEALPTPLQERMESIYEIY